MDTGWTMLKVDLKKLNLNLMSNVLGLRIEEAVVAIQEVEMIVNKATNLIDGARSEGLGERKNSGESVKMGSKGEVHKWLELASDGAGERRSRNDKRVQRWWLLSGRRIDGINKTQMAIWVVTFAESR